jgi:hypothetical protein
VAPLLGLLGTVTGMIVTFQAITVFGTGDPQLMAGGISQALVTTVLGLITAVPLLFAHTALAGRSRHLAGVVEGQASAALAEQLEQRVQRLDASTGKAPCSRSGLSPSSGWSRPAGHAGGHRPGGGAAVQPGAGAGAVLPPHLSPGPAKR